MLPTTLAKPAPAAILAVPVAAPPVIAPPVVTPHVVSAPVAYPPVAVVAAPVVAPTRLSRNDELPDFLDGRARNRRALMVVIGIALLALLGTIAAAIASHYRPI